MSQCLSPFIVKDKIKGDIPVPCGKCYYCLMRRISGWHFRLKNELKYAKTATFLTLTYNSDNVPFTEDGLLTLNKVDLQKFFKRLRYYDSKKGKCLIRYYAVGEYGSKNDRPHYHAILFNAQENDCVKAWTLGNIFFGDVTDESIGYVTGYVQKSFYAQWGDDGRSPPFANMSKYLGVNYLSPAIYNWHKKDLDNRMYIPIEGGKKISMPRYFKDLIYTEAERKHIGEAAKVRSEELFLEREKKMVEKYGDRAPEIDLEQKKMLYKKLQNKKQKRKL